VLDRDRVRERVARLKRAPIQVALMIVVAAVIFLAFTLAFNPWVFWIGGRFTPGMSWSALGTFGKGTAPKAIYLDLSYSPPGESSDGTDDLVGTGLTCNDHGMIDRWQARLETSSAWLNADGKKAELDLSRANGKYPDGTPRFDRLVFRGAWQESNLVLKDSSGRVGLLFYAHRRDFEQSCR
jgi:hypothetical protein